MSKGSLNSLGFVNNLAITPAHPWPFHSISCIMKVRNLVQRKTCSVFGLDAVGLAGRRCTCCRSSDAAAAYSLRMVLHSPLHDPQLSKRQNLKPPKKSLKSHLVH